MINWKVRIKNKMFWISIIPLALLLIQQVCSVFGLVIDVTDLGEKLLAIVGTVFAILGLIGVINDPTTDGMADSKNAMTYKVPKKD